jgi:hypothetical protein
VKKVVLAYSGGLDTSIILKWLQTTYGCEVVTFTADLGQGEELEPARKKAELMGVKQIFIDDLREEFVRDFVLPMFRANALYEGQYLLGTSIARPLIAKRQIEIARRRGRRRRRLPTAPPARATTRSASSSPLLRAAPRHPRHRAVARMGSRQPHRADRLRREEPDPDRQGQARRGAVLGRRQPPAHLRRGQGARGSVGGAGRVRVPALGRAGAGAGQADRTSRSSSRRAIRSRSTARSSRRPRCSPSSTRSAASTASAASTWSRTASSA